MFRHPHSRPLLCGLLALLAPLLPAQEPASSPAPAAATPLPADSEPLTDPNLLAGPPGAVTPSQNVTINLIRRLVERGVLTKEDATELMKQAEADTQAARAQAQADAQDAVAQVATQLTKASAPVPPPDDDTVRVTYIPEFVKAQLRDQIKSEVFAQAKAEHWAAPDLLPSWVPRSRVAGDIRLRFEGDYFPEGNDTTGAFPNFNAINTGAPFDISGNVFSPQLNVDEDRHRLRLRLRLGAEVQMGDGFTAGLRIATGENNSPVSTNQTFGASGGNFSKYSLWLDRGFLSYQLGPDADHQLKASVGRFDNPFFATEAIYDDDLGFDGAALSARTALTPAFTPFGTVGAFPIFNTDLNFATNQPDKFPSDDKYLYGGQVGFDWKIVPPITLKLALAYYDFTNVAGRLSRPFIPLSASDAGNTDNTRPSFAQKGNTYRPLRDIIPSPLNNFGTIDQFQYFGLATSFRDLALTGRLDLNYFEPVQISLMSEYIKNTAFNQAAIDAIAVNNRGPDNRNGSVGPFAGGDTAWIIGLKVGAVALQKRGDWNLGINYRHIESDAVIDGLVDSDFGLGGTNLEGYTLQATVALSPNVSLSARYMSANEVAGQPFKVDLFQLDLAGKF